MLRQYPLSKIEHGVLWHLAAALPPAGDVIAQAQLATDLAANPAYVGRAMQRLCKIGLLQRGVRVHLSYHYKLNPAYLRILI